MALKKPLFPFMSKMTAFLWTLVATVKRMMVLVLYFAPSLGLFDLLYHWKYEQLQFSIRKRNTISVNDVLHLRDIEPIAWSELDRWHYHDSYEIPSPPPYTIYTRYSCGEYFLIFLVILIFQACANVAFKFLTSKKFYSESSALDKIIHGIEISNLPSPWKDWDENAITVEDHMKQSKSVSLEMTTTILVNSIFSIIMLLPFNHTGDVPSNCSR